MSPEIIQIHASVMLIVGILQPDQLSSRQRADSLSSTTACGRASIEGSVSPHSTLGPVPQPGE